ncbi:hypothetical protein O6H91_01G028200 [Diphasiastrum complanatum]|uniref:Uncharacterized protein n=1 Tax=Diphasiastrum complanatum TaxID=34168 RepID=A0ACC2EPB2_DIPCM|nr:hypothetical protein O6H91_01G028200 [Diphasiastrum complanatum]
MGADRLVLEEEAKHGAIPSSPPSLIVGLQPVALVDHVARVDWSLLAEVPGERGGSMRVTSHELDRILAEVNLHVIQSPAGGNAIRRLAGGSVANTIRGLAGGLGVNCAIVGTRGDDEQGAMFATNMQHSKVDLSRLRVKAGPTGQCVCLVDAEGNRTMRPCLSDAVRLQADELTREDFRGAKVVRSFRNRLLKLLKSRMVDLCFVNEDEARELMRDQSQAGPEAALEFLSCYCTTAVVMLGSKGCIARRNNEVVSVPALQNARAVDTTGAGDLFASGFLYGMLHELPLDTCCKIGCCTGAAVVQDLGGEIGLENWHWMYQQMKARDLPLPDTTRVLI